jgi:protein involved in polysaccharide export with SLBB domain
MTRCFRWLATLPSLTLLFWALSASTGLAQGTDPKDFIVGPEDVLEVQVWDNKDLNQSVFVRPDGKTSLPLVGEIQAAGKTVQELQDYLSAVYSKTVKGAAVTVIIRDIKSRPVYFVGGFGKPGPIQLTRDLTLLQAISVVGGLATTADGEKSFILRQGKLIPVDFVKLVQKGDMLLLFDGAPFEEEIRRSQASLGQAEADAQKAQQDLKLQSIQNQEELAAARQKVERSRLELADVSEGKGRLREEEATAAVGNAERDLEKAVGAHDDLKPLLALDASARVRTVYDCWEHGRGGIVRLPDAPKRYDDLSIHVWDRGGGKSGFRKDGDQLVEGIASTILSQPDEPWLVVHHKAKSIGRDIEDEVGALLPPAARVHFLNWGAHDATNEYADVPNIIGIKDSSGDLQNTIEIIRNTPRERFAVLNGRDTLILAALQFGAQGAIPASCNIAPDLCVGIYETFVKGDIEAAKSLQSRLHPIRMAMTLGTGNSAVKEAMALLGRPAGPSRSPLSAFSDEKKAKFDAWMIETKKPRRRRPATTNRVLPIFSGVACAASPC